MRKVLWAAAIVASLAGSSSAWAQKSLSSYGSVNPNQVVNRPIDMSNAVASPVSPPTKRLFGLDNFFSRIAIPGLPQRTAVSPLPAASSYPSTQYRSPISPLPILSSK